MKTCQEVWRRSDWGTSPAEELVERCVGDSRGQGSDPDGEQLPLYETEEKDVALWVQFTLKTVRKHYIKKASNLRFHRISWTRGRWLRFRSVLVQSINVSDLQRSGTTCLSDDPLSRILRFFLDHWLIWDVLTGTEFWREPTNNQRIQYQSDVSSLHLSETFWDAYHQERDYSRHQTEIRQLPLRWHVFSRPRSSAPRWIPSPKMTVKKKKQPHKANIITPYTQ